MKYVITSIITAAGFAGAATAQAERVCMPTPELEAALVDWYAERPVAETEGGKVLWASSRKDTWTLVNHRADRTSCVVAQGTGSWSDSAASDLVAQLD